MRYLKIFVVNTKQCQSGKVQSRVVEDDRYDVMVLVQGMSLDVDDLYNHYPDPYQRYSLYVRNKVDIARTFIEEEDFCGILLPDFNIMALRVDADMSQDFVYSLNSRYPDRTILAIPSRHSGVVFDIQTGVQGENPTFGIKPSNYSVFIDKELLRRS